MNIMTTTKTETVTTVVYHLTLTDADVAAVLANPAKLQAQLRALRAAQAKGRHGHRNIVISKAGRPKAAAADGAAKLTCPHCGLVTKSRIGLGVHLSRAHKGQPAPGAGS